MAREKKDSPHNGIEQLASLNLICQKRHGASVVMAGRYHGCNIETCPDAGALGARLGL